MIDLISKGGPLMWLLLACSCLALGIFVERFYHFHRSQIDVGHFLQGLRNLIDKKNYAEALQECAGTPGPVARVIHAAILRHGSSRAELKEIVQEQGQLEVPRLERYLSVLATIAYIAPLIGLLGTIIGLIDTFMFFSRTPSPATTADLSGGVYESLITSAVGLVVAIPTFILYSYLRTNARTLMHDMERGGIDIVNIITDAKSQSDIVSLDDERQAEAARKSRRDSRTRPTKDRGAGHET